MPSVPGHTLAVSIVSMIAAITVAKMIDQSGISSKRRNLMPSFWSGDRRFGSGQTILGLIIAIRGDRPLRVSERDCPARPGG